jgi:hypothetical protein
MELAQAVLVVHTLVKRAHSRSMCMENHERASDKAVAIGRDVKRDFLNQSTTCRRVVTTKERSNPASRFKDVLWGVAPRCIVSIGVKTVFVYDMPPGARLSEVSVLQTLTGRGTNLSCWGEWYRRPKYRAKRTTEMGSRGAGWVRKRSKSVLTPRYRCCGCM